MLSHPAVVQNYEMLLRRYLIKENLISRTYKSAVSMISMDAASRLSAGTPECISGLQPALDPPRLEVNCNVEPQDTKASPTKDPHIKASSIAKAVDHVARAP